MMNDIISMGRKAYMDGVPISSNPFPHGSTENGIWSNAWLGEQLEVEQLGSQFSANKEDVEKKEQLIVEMTTQITTLEDRIDCLEDFLLELRDNPPFWAKTYKKKIVDFCSALHLPES